jgi:hypothetical protein
MTTDPADIIAQADTVMESDDGAPDAMTMVRLLRDALIAQDAVVSALEAENARLREAIKPMVEHAVERCSDDPAWTERDAVTCILSIPELRRARAALTGEGE